MAVVSEDGGNKDLLGELAADGHFRAANGADEVAAVGDFAELHLLTEAEIAEAITGRAVETANAHITIHGHLVEGDLASRSEGRHGGRFA
jgi:dihydrodipicolinate synthase/N-acetylneuraminate lyase